MREGEIWERGQRNMSGVVRDIYEVMGNEGRGSKVLQVSNGGKKE